MVTAFLDQAADAYEHALSALGRLREGVARLEEQLQGHRAREAAQYETLQKAQRLADEMREQAHEEARGMLQEAQHRAELVLQQVPNPKDTSTGRQITGLHLARLEAEISLEASLTTLRSVLARVGRWTNPSGSPTVAQAASPWGTQGRQPVSPPSRWRKKAR